MKVLHFGAGNIGRGFIGKLLSDSGHEVIFADVAPQLIDNLAARKSFMVNVVGRDCRQEKVTIQDAVFSNAEGVVEELLQNVDMVTTAVGPRILERIAPTLARGLQLRRQSSEPKPPMNIVACENAIRASSSLKEFVYKNLDPDTIEWANVNVGFVDCAVDRIVPPARHEDPLEVTVEEFSEWIVDQTQVKGISFTALSVPSVKFTQRLDAYVERKLMTVNTGHAVCAYVGKLYGYKDIRSAINNPAVLSVVYGAMQESGKVLCRRFSMDEKEHEEYILKILDRFRNPYIKDDVLRVGREPIRKLGPNERLIKPLKGCLEYVIPCDNLVKGIAGALLYQNPEDPQAVELQTLIREKGMMEALIHISGLHIDTNKAPLERVALAASEFTTVAQI